MRLYVPGQQQVGRLGSGRIGNMNVLHDEDGPREKPHIDEAVDPHVTAGEAAAVGLDIAAPLGPVDERRHRQGSRRDEDHHDPQEQER